MWGSNQQLRLDMDLAGQTSWMVSLAHQPISLCSRILSVAVADAMGPRLLLISSTGTVRRTVGRPGDGPGEIGESPALLGCRMGNSWSTMPVHRPRTRFYTPGHPQAMVRLPLLWETFHSMALTSRSGFAVRFWRIRQGLPPQQAFVVLDDALEESIPSLPLRHRTKCTCPGAFNPVRTSLGIRTGMRSMERARTTDSGY